MNAQGSLIELAVNGVRVPWFYAETKRTPRERHPCIPTTPNSRNLDVHAPTLSLVKPGREELKQSQPKSGTAQFTPPVYSNNRRERRSGRETPREAARRRRKAFEVAVAIGMQYAPEEAGPMLKALSDRCGVPFVELAKHAAERVTELRKAAREAAAAEEASAG